MIAHPSAPNAVAIVSLGKYRSTAQRRISSGLDCSNRTLTSESSSSVSVAVDIRYHHYDPSTSQDRHTRLVKFSILINMINYKFLAHNTLRPSDLRKIAFTTT